MKLCCVSGNQQKPLSLTVNADTGKVRTGEVHGYDSRDEGRSHGHMHNSSGKIPQ